MSRSVLITGASTGIGRAAALHLARKGHQVFAGVRKEADGESLTAEVSSIEPVLIDVADSASIEACRAVVNDRLGARGLDGLVNNAGVAVGGPLEFLPLDELRMQFEVNVVGQIAVTQAFLPFVRARRGRIVFVSSIAGRAPALPLIGPYSASKSALEDLADALRMELRADGIEVSVIQPGSIATEIWEKGDKAAASAFENYPPEALDRYGSAMEKGRKAAAASGRRGISPLKVAEKIEHALTSARPHSRYLVGNDAKVRAFVEPVLPTRLRDRVVTRYLGFDD